MSDILSSTFAEERRRLDSEQESLRSRLNIIDDSVTPDDAAVIDRARRMQPNQAPPVTRQEADEAIRSYQADRALRVSPRLQRYLSEPSHAAMARDDVQSLSMWESLGRLAAISPAAAIIAGNVQVAREIGSGDVRYSDFFRQGQRNIESARLGNRANPKTWRAYDALGPLNAAERQRLEELEQMPRLRAQGLVEPVVEQLPQILGAFDAGGRRAVRDMRQSWRQVYGEDAQTIADNPVAAALLAPVAGVGAAISGVGGAARGVVGFTYEQEAGGAFLEYRQLRDKEGRLIDVDIAADAARRVGEINAAVEFIGLGGAARAAGATELVDVLTSRAVRTALRRRGFMEATGRLAMGAGGAAFSEGTTELTQEGVTIALGQLAQEQQGGEWEELNPDEIAGRLWEAFRVGATVGGVLGSVPASGRFVTDIAAVRDARHQQEVFEALSQSAQDSKLRARSPSRYADAVDALTANGPIDEVSIDADRFVALFQERGEDAFRVADELRGVGADALRQALESGTDLKIPMGTYAAQIAASTVHRDLSQHVRMGAGQMTAAEVSARFELGVDIERAVGEAQRLQAEATEKLTEMEGVRERIEAMFSGAESYTEQATARFADYYAVAIETMATRAGMKPSALLDEIGLAIEGPFNAISAGEDLQQPTRGKGPDAAPVRSGRWDIPDGVNINERNREYIELAMNGASDAWIANEYDSTRNAVAVTLNRLAKKLKAAQVPVPWGESERGAMPGVVSQTGEAAVSDEQIMSLFETLKKEGFRTKPGIGVGGLTAYQVMAERFRMTPSAVAQRMSLARKKRARASLGEQATDAQVDMAELRRRWVDEHVVSRPVPGGAPGDFQHAFVLSDGTIMEVGIGDDGNGAASIEWTFLNRMIEGLSPEQLYAKMAEYFTPSLWREFTAGLHSIIERDIEMHGRPAYVFTPYTEAHRRAYQQLIARFGAFNDYTFREDTGVFHFFHPGAGIAANDRIKPQADWEPNFGEVPEEPNDPAEAADARDAAQGEFYAAAKGLDPASNSPRDLAASERAQRQALARARAGDREGPGGGPGGGSGGQGLEQRKSGPSGPSGAIFMRHLREGGDLRQATIKLFEGRDLSTPLHEGGHLFLEVLQLLAGKEGASEQLTTDWQTVLDWFGVTAEQWDAMTLEQKRPYHEQFARGNEAYLMTAEAPSSALKQVFAVFKRWLTWIYKSALALDVQLTPEMRGVFDRMIATDEAIEAVRAEQGAGPRDLIPRENFGGTDKQYERYVANIEIAREAALADLQKEAMGALIADRTRWWRSEEARARKTVIATMAEEPQWRAYDALSGAVIPEGMTEPVRLSPAVVLAEYGQGVLDALPPEIARADVDALLNQALTAKRTLRTREPTRFTARVQQLGGVRDPGGDVKAIIGSARARPGLINNATGLDPDEMALRLWEEGYFGVPPGRLFQNGPDAGPGPAQQVPDGGALQGEIWPLGLFQGERPTVREFLDKLEGDIKGTQPAYSEDDKDIVAAREEAEKIKSWFSQQGIDINTKDSDLRAEIAKIATREDTRGIDPEIAASIFGFGSGEELLKSLANIRPKREVIEERTRQRMLQEYGDPFATGEMMESALKAAHREAQAKVIEIELDAIDRAIGSPNARPVSRVARDIAEEQIARMTVRQIRKYEWFLGNERRHAKEAMAALADGDPRKARLAKHRQLVNFHLYSLARAATEELARAQKYFRKLETSQTVRGRIDTDYLDQIDGLLEQYEFRKITKKTEQRRINLAEWARQMEAKGLGHLVVIDPRILTQAQSKPYSQMELDEVRALVDTVKNIEHLGRLKDKLLDAADKRAFRETVSGLADRMNETGPLGQAVTRNYSPTAFERAQEGMRKWHAEMTRMEFLFRHLDGGKANGPLWRALWLPFAKAADKESAMMRGAAESMEQVWSSAYTRAERARMFKKRHAMPDLPVGAATHYTKAELLAIALNLGNEGNVRALVDGFNWGGGRELAAGDYTVAKEQILAALTRVLEPRDWITVQRIWDLIGTFRDEAFALQKDLTGLEPQAVEAQPIKLADGTTLQGGYYPLKFDRTRNLDVERAEAKQDVQDMWGSNWSRPMTRKGHLIERVGSGGRPVKLSLTVFSEHVQNVVHDIAYRRAVVDADRIITDSQFAETFVSVAGRPMYDQLRPWLQAIAADRTDPSAMMWKLLLKLRGNVAIAAMGYRISTGLQQLVGVFQAVPHLGAGAMSNALIQLVGNPAGIAQKARIIANKSEFMRNRMNTLDRDIRETIDKMERSDPLHPIRHNAFALVGMFDWAVSSVVWTAGYNKALEGKVDGIDSGDEAAAVAYADQAVRITQSAGLPQDLPAKMRGSEVNKLLTMFFSYFSVLYNWTAYDQVMGARKGRVPPHVFMANIALIYVISPLIAEALAGRWEPREDEDDEERNARLAMVVAKMPFMTLPVVRDVVNVLGTGFEYQLSPVGSAPGQIADAVNDVVEGRTFESEATTKRALVAAGYAFGLPTPQAWIMIDYLADKLEGEEEGFDPVEAFVSDRR